MEADEIVKEMGDDPIKIKEKSEHVQKVQQPAIKQAPEEYDPLAHPISLGFKLAAGFWMFTILLGMILFLVYYFAGDMILQLF